MAQFSFYEKGCNMPLFITLIFGIGGLGAIFGNSSPGTVFGIIFILISIITLFGTLIPRVKKYTTILNQIKETEKNRLLNDMEKRTKDDLIKLLGVIYNFIR